VHACLINVYVITCAKLQSSIECTCKLSSLIDCLYCGQDLLEDPCPTVRATAIHGVCRITGVFWELIPAHIIKMFLTTLVRETHWDQHGKGSK